MSNRPTYVEIGDTIEVYGVKYECVPAGVTGCDLADHCGMVACTAEERIDGKNVIFKRIEQ